MVYISYDFWSVGSSFPFSFSYFSKKITKKISMLVQTELQTLTSKEKKKRIGQRYTLLKTTNRQTLLAKVELL